MTRSTLSSIRRDESTCESIEALAARLVQQQATKHDYLVDTRLASFATEQVDALQADADGNVKQPDVPTRSTLTFDADGGIVSGPINEHAHSQIAERVGIPRKYYDRMRVEATELLDTNVGHWFRAKPETRMIRMLDGNVRAVMSARYKRRDNFDLMEQAVLPTFGGPAGHLFQFHVAHLTPDRLFVRALLPSVQAEVTVGDIVQAGVQIRNSEVGMGALEVTPFIWRLQCLNGMVVEDGRMRAYHVSGVQEADEHSRIFTDETVRADDHAFFLKARDAIAAAVDESVFGAAVERMREATTGERIRQPAAATQRVAQTFDLNDRETESVLIRLAAGGSMTKWAMANAVTAAAKDAPSFERQEEMERLGGRVISLTPREWQPIALAVA